MLSELNLVQGLTASQYLSPSLPFCLRFNAGLRGKIAEAIRTLGPYTNTAKLDTEPLAKSYSGGLRFPLDFKPFPVRTCNRRLPAINLMGCISLQSLASLQVTLQLFPGIPDFRRT